MTTQLTLEHILKGAVQKEIQSQEFYFDLSNRVVEENVKFALQELAKQEKDHEELLESYLQGKLEEGALDIEQVVDYKIAEHLDQLEISPQMELKDVFMLAAEREKVAHEFYLCLAGIHPVGEVRKLLEELASQEMSHKHKVEFLYTEVAFPQTDGG